MRPPHGAPRNDTVSFADALFNATPNLAVTGLHNANVGFITFVSIENLTAAPAAEA